MWAGGVDRILSLPRSWFEILVRFAVLCFFAVRLVVSWKCERTVHAKGSAFILTRPVGPCEELLRMSLYQGSTSRKIKKL